MLFWRQLNLFKINFFKNVFQNTIRVSNSLDPNQAWMTCLHRYSTDEGKVIKVATSW